MNLLSCTNLDAAGAAAQAALPPPRTSPRAPGDPARVLFVNAFELGFATTSRNLHRYCETRGDIHAVHFAMHMPRWLRLLCAQTPFKARWDLHASRMFWGWSAYLRRWLTGPLDVRRFDAVHILTQQRSHAVSSLRRHSPSTRFIVNVDATLAGWDRDYELVTHASPFQLNIERRIYHAADAVAAASRWVARSLTDDYGLPAERQILHMPCVPVDAAAAARPRPSPAPGQPLRIVFIGNDFFRKGGDRLVAWHRARWSDRAELHICSANAPSSVSQEGGAGITFHGAVPHDRLVNDLLPTMHLLVVPTHEDTFLIAAQEAQALGVPVITSRLCGIPEVVLHERTGLLCHRRDDAAFIAAVERLIDDRALLAALSRQAAEHARSALNADVWHNHLLDQVVNLVERRPIAFAPPPSPPPPSLPSPPSRSTP